MSAAGPVGTTPGDELRSVLAMLRRRRITIGVGIVAVFAAVAAATFYWPRTYESAAVVLVEDPGTGPDSPALAVLERMGRSNQIETEIELLRSRHVLARAVDQLDRHVTVSHANGTQRPGEFFVAFEAGPSVVPGRYRIAEGIDSTYVVRDEQTDSVVTVATSRRLQFAGVSALLPATLPASGVVVRVTDFPRAVESARRRVSASRLRREADLIGVSCEGSSPTEAQQLCAIALENYILLRTGLQRAEATTTAEFLREQVGRLGERLANSEDELEQYKRRNRIVALDERASAEVRQVTELRARRDAIEAERQALAQLIANVEYEARGSGKYRDLASFPTFLMNHAVTEILASLVELENRRSDLAVRRTTQNADLAALDTRISDIEAQLRSLATSYERSLAAQVQSLDRTLERTQRGLASIPTQQVQSARLERQTDLIEELYKLLETRLREAEVAEAVDLPSVRIVDPASTPYEPSAPNVPVNLALGLFLGLAYGLGMALYREYRDPLHERDEVARETGLPVLGMIPRMKAPGPLLPVTRTPRDKNGAPSASPRPLKKHQLVGELALEAVRGLAAELSFAGAARKDGPLRSVAVTGATRGEGKTFTACNLALVRAMHGARTLLIDGDMRARGVAEFFGLSTASPGLSDVLAGHADLPDVWQQVQGGGANLWVVPAGTVTPHAVSLLEAPAFAALLDRAARHFDFIVIDTPPLSVTTDAATIATRVHAVVLVVRGGITDRVALDMSLERLKRARGNLVGVVINDIPLSSGYVSQYTYAEPVSV